MTPLCEAGRIFDPSHPTCRTCRIGCASKSIAEATSTDINRISPTVFYSVCLAPTLDEIGKKHGLPGKAACPYEEQEQRILAKFLDLKFPDEWFHVPNGRMRSKADAGKLKAEGVKKGVPDNFIIRPVGDSPGVVIELKRKVGGTVSPEQKKWLATLLHHGWITVVAKGAGGAIDTVREIYQI